MAVDYESSPRRTWERQIAGPLDALVEMGAQVKVSYETRTTRLHAKAWVFKQATGYLLRVRRLVEPVEERVAGWA